MGLHTTLENKMKSLLLLTILPAFYAQTDSDYAGYDYQTDSSKTRPQLTTESGTTTNKPQNDFELFESITEIIKYTSEELQNLQENPFLAEHKAYEVLNKIKGSFSWNPQDRKRKLFDSNVEDTCVEEQCTYEEMNEDFENWPKSQQNGMRGKVPTDSYQKYVDCYKSFDRMSRTRKGYKTRNNIRKNCLPYEWNKVGLPTKYDQHNKDLNNK